MPPQSSYTLAEGRLTLFALYSIIRLQGKCNIWASSFSWQHFNNIYITKTNSMERLKLVKRKLNIFSTLLWAKNPQKVCGIFLVGSTTGAYKGWLKANIFVDNSFPLSGQLPPCPAPTWSALWWWPWWRWWWGRWSLSSSYFRNRSIWAKDEIIKLPDDVIVKSCERKGLF